MTAKVTSLQICVGHRKPMSTVESATFIAGVGIEGDRHAVPSGALSMRQVLLMDENTLEDFGLAIGEIRENVTVSGIKIHEVAVGQRVALGDDVVVAITQFCVPCGRMDEIRPGLREDIREQRGMLTTVISGGVVKVGDEIRVIESAEVS